MVPGLGSLVLQSQALMIIGLARLVLGERLDQTKVAAAGLVFGGLALVVFQPRFRRRSAGRSAAGPAARIL